MNRIKLSPLATDTTDTKGNSGQPSPVQVLDTPSPLSQNCSDEFSLFVPLHYEKNHAYPLVVWLHGDGESADQIQSVMLEMSMRNYVGIAPQSPVGNSDTGYHWDQSWDTIDRANDSVLAAIDQARLRFNIHSQRIFLAGSGSGGTMAFRIALAHPEIFAGVMSIGGPIPDDQSPLRDWSRCRELPVFWAHGRRSTEFAQDQLCRQLRLLHIAGFSVTLRQYPQNDLLCQNTLADMNRWIMELITSSVP